MVRHDLRSESATIRYELAESLPEVDAVEDQIVQVCINLALNAFDAMASAPPERARVLWLGVATGADELVALAARVEAAVGRAGFPPESRAYHPHLTLSRLEPPRDISQLCREAPLAPIQVYVDEVLLFRSHLGHGPARHEVLHSCRLTAAP